MVQRYGLDRGPGILTVLADKGRPVLHLHLTDRAEGIAQLLHAL